MRRLSGRVALVTGAASGIGLATARRFAAEGASVILVDRNQPLLAEAHEALGAVSPAGHEAIVLDVTDEAGWITLASHIAERHGRLDVLVNNAGYGRFASIAETSFADWRSILAVNLDSIFLSTKHLMPLLAASGQGSIVNVSSIRGIVAAANTGPYCASKGGVRMFTKATALECAEAGNGVRANSIHPGHIHTPLSAAAHADPETAKKLKADIPSGRLGQPEEIADAILFLACDESRYMTGAELVVDGGSTAQ